jgi:hypothetical protein
MITSGAVKELFERGRGLRGPWVKGISFYLTASKRDLLDLHCFKGIPDPVKKLLVRQAWNCISRWVVTRCCAGPLLLGG